MVRRNAFQTWSSITPKRALNNRVTCSYFPFWLFLVRVIAVSWSATSNFSGRSRTQQVIFCLQKVHYACNNPINSWAKNELTVFITNNASFAAKDNTDCPADMVTCNGSELNRPCFVYTSSGNNKNDFNLIQKVTAKKLDTFQTFLYYLTSLTKMDWGEQNEQTNK